VQLLLVPLQAHVYALSAMSQLETTISMARQPAREGQRAQGRRGKGRAAPTRGAGPAGGLA